MQTIDSLLRSRCETFADRIALRQKVSGVWQETTYRDLWCCTSTVSTSLCPTTAAFTGASIWTCAAAAAAGLSDSWSSDASSSRSAASVVDPASPAQPQLLLQLWLC